MRRVQIFYLRFDTQTFAPVTKESIEKQATCHFTLPLESYAARSLGQLVADAATGAFSNEVVRLKMVIPAAGDVYLDAEGGVLAADGQERRMSDSAFLHAKGLMEALEQVYCG